MHMCTDPHEHLHLPQTQRVVGVGREGDKVLSADYQTNVAGGKQQIANLKNIIVYDLFYLNYVYMCLHLHVGTCMCTIDDDIVHPEEGIGFLRAGATGSCEPPDRNAGY